MSDKTERDPENIRKKALERDKAWLNVRDEYAKQLEQARQREADLREALDEISRRVDDLPSRKPMPNATWAAWTELREHIAKARAAKENR